MAPDGIVAAYVRIETAEDLRFPDRSSVPTPAAFLGWHRHMLEERGAVARAWVCDLQVEARIEHGRWIACCPNCRTGSRTHPEWGLGCCGECGCIFRRVTFPPNVAEIERVLLRRPLRWTQNWLPGETLADLERENANHGLE